jgi:hypothetical protein
MTTSTTIPVTVNADAAARIAKLGFQAQVDRMIDHARQHLPEVERIEVVLYDRYELGDEPGVSIDIYSRRPSDPADTIVSDMIGWRVREFPSAVLAQILMDYFSGEPHVG